MEEIRMNIGKLSERILDKIYDVLIEMKERLENIETYLKKEKNG